jgi:hypothetical protein
MDIIDPKVEYTTLNKVKREEELGKFLKANTLSGCFEM